MKKIRNGASSIECVQLQTKYTTLVLSFCFFFSQTISSLIIFYLFLCFFFWFCQTPNLTKPSSPPLPFLSVAPLRGDALSPPSESYSPAANSSSASDHLNSMISSRDPDALFSGGGISFLAGTRPVKFSYGYSSLKGKRLTMEDFFETRISDVNGQMVAFFGVYDGHGGARTADYLKNNLFKNLISHNDFISDTNKAIVESFKQTDEEYLIEETGQPKSSGSTASTALLIGDKLIVANVGDSRVVASRNGSAVPLSDDHKPNRSDERQRIEDAGGFVIRIGTWRVGGILAVSRAFGDKQLKPYVIAEPEIQEEDISTLEFLIIASDGLWNVLSNKDAVAIVRDISDAETASRKLVQEAYTRGSFDNITCIVVIFEVS